MTVEQIQKDRLIVAQIKQRIVSEYGQAAEWFSEITKRGDEWIVKIPGQEPITFRLQSEQV